MGRGTLTWPNQSAKNNSRGRYGPVTVRVECKKRQERVSPASHLSPLEFRRPSAPFFPLHHSGLLSLPAQQIGTATAITKLGANLSLSLRLSISIPQIEANASGEKEANEPADVKPNGPSETT